MAADISKSREMERLRKKLTVDLLWIYLLGILRKEPMHAYALRSEIEKRFGFLPGNVSAYVVLYKLQSRGFVSSLQKGNRTVYSITQKGKELLKEAEKEFSAKQKMLFK
ncbi:MAG: PadR family transcriptional regulator [Candidatus ainarchaeum sp.]|nr:PadR family transcriptional regulator [Candidatus ainarchaeum sp.]